MNGAMELLRAAQEGDRDACEQAVLENNGLIWSVVRRYYGRGVEPDDLYQLGCLGFLKAVQGFDFTYGTCFSTYAVPKIAGEIRRFLRDDGAVKVGRSIREQSLTLYALRERLRQELGREPALSELAAHEAAELCRGGGLAGAVEAHHHRHRRGMGGGGQLAGLGAHQGDELLVDDLDDLLGGGQGVQHVAADGPLRDLGHEVLDHLVADVGFQQGEADLPHALLHVRLGEAALAPQALEGLVQFFA